MLADIASPIYLGLPGLFAYSLISLMIIVLIEAIVLRLLRWGTWKIAFLHAFIINLVTSLIGTGLITFAKAENFAYDVPLPVLFSAAFLVTVIVEAAELKVLRVSASFPRIIVNSLVANIFSYVFLAATMYLALFPPVTGYGGNRIHYPLPTPISSPRPSPSPSS
jgi:hypothetical protein